MPQTTGQMSWENTKLEHSNNGSTWTDVSGSTNSVELSGGDVETDKLYTHVTPAPIIGYGKPDLMTVTVNVVYTEVAGEAYETFRADYEGKLDTYLRWSPKGGLTGNKRYTAAKGRITSPIYPQGKSEEATPVQLSAVLTTPSIAQDTVP